MWPCERAGWGPATTEACLLGTRPRSRYCDPVHTFFEALGGIHALIAVLMLIGYVLYLLKKTGPVPALMLWPARLQLLLGLVLVGLAEGALDMSLNHMKVGIKLLVALAVVACLEIANAARRKDHGQGRPALVHAAAALVIVNILVAYLVS